MKKVLMLTLIGVMLCTSMAYAVKYRVQVDIDFDKEVDADAFEAYVVTLQDKMYDVSLEDIIKDPELYTSNRMHVIRDYDDEGAGAGGVTVRDIELKKPITR